MKEAVGAGGEGVGGGLSVGVRCAVGEAVRGPGGEWWVVEGGGLSPSDDCDDLGFVLGGGKKKTLHLKKNPTQPSPPPCQILPLATIISVLGEKRAHFLFTPPLLPEYCL